MRVIQTPEGSRTRFISVTVDGERVSVSFKKDGTANVGNERAKKLCEAVEGLTLVGDEMPDEDTEEE